jgi:hypothetical protein
MVLGFVVTVFIMQSFTITRCIVVVLVVVVVVVLVVVVGIVVVVVVCCIHLFDCNVPKYPLLSLN